MLIVLKRSVWVFVFVFSVSQGFAQVNCVNYQSQTPNYAGPWNPLWNFASMKQNKVVINDPGGIGGDYLFFGMLEYLPTGYAPLNTNIKHPLIIFFHGGASKGNAKTNIDQLCRLFKDNDFRDSATFKSLPGRVERSTSSFSQDGKDFIVISPQFEAYRRDYPENPSLPNIYPSATNVEKVINWIIARYPGKIDETRIYLTGYSNGANMIMEYVGSSVARAQRIAAVMPVSLCSQLNHFSNTNIGVSAANIGNAKLKTWFVQCSIDNPCGTTSTDWVNGINAVSGSVAPRYTVLNNSGSATATLYNCSDSLLHDAWSRAYDPNFKASFIGGNVTGTNDGVNKNMYEWFMASTNSVLPVVMKSYSARLVNDHVEIDWATTDEKNNSHFTIERSGADQQFHEIGKVNGAGDFSGERKYSFKDNAPLAGLSHYRLSQTDIDGKRTYFEIKKIINRNGTQNAISVTPNPFGSELAAYISLSRSQKVFISITDMNGKTVKSTSGIYGQGSSEIKLSAHELSSGVYLFKVSGEDFSSTQKVVKK